MILHVHVHVYDMYIYMFMTCTSTCFQTSDEQVEQFKEWARHDDDEDFCEFEGNCGTY